VAGDSDVVYIGGVWCFMWVACIAALTVYCIVGAIVGLTALGHQAVRNALYPNLQPYIALLQKEMQQSGNEMKRYEAYKCFGALLHAAGMAIRDRVKYGQLCMFIYVCMSVCCYIRMYV